MLSLPLRKAYIFMLSNYQAFYYSFTFSGVMLGKITSEVLNFSVLPLGKPFIFLYFSHSNSKPFFFNLWTVKIRFEYTNELSGNLPKIHVLIQWVWNGTRESACSTTSQVMLMPDHTFWVPCSRISALNPLYSLLPSSIGSLLNLLPLLTSMNPMGSNFNYFTPSFFWNNPSSLHPSIDQATISSSLQPQHHKGNQVTAIWFYSKCMLSQVRSANFHFIPFLFLIVTLPNCN